MNPQIKEAQRVSRRLKCKKRKSSKHTINKLCKISDKNKILKAVRGKTLHKGKTKIKHQFIIIIWSIHQEGITILNVYDLITELQNT